MAERHQVIERFADEPGRAVNDAQHAKVRKVGPDGDDAVAVLGIHIGLDLEDEGRHVVFFRLDHAARSFLRPRRRRKLGQSVKQILDAEILQRGAEINRREMSLSEGGKIERLAGLFHQ